MKLAGGFENRFNMRDGNPLSAMQWRRRCCYRYIAANMQGQFPNNYSKLKFSDIYSKLKLPEHYGKLKFSDKYSKLNPSDNHIKCINSSILYGAGGSSRYRLQHGVSRNPRANN